MDLPLAQLNQSNVTLSENNIVITHQYNGTLLTLEKKVTEGDYHILVKDHNKVGTLYHIKSKFDFDTLNVYTLKTRLNNLLSFVDLELVDMGLLYRMNSTLFMGDAELAENKDGSIYLC